MNAAAASGPSKVLQSVPATPVWDRADTIMNTGIKTMRTHVTILAGVQTLVSSLLLSFATTLSYSTT